MDFKLPIAKLVKTVLSNNCLTAREMEILLLQADGWSNKEIADMLVLSCATVDTHNRSIVAALKAKNMKHAIAIALRTGVIE